VSYAPIDAAGGFDSSKSSSGWGLTRPPYSGLAIPPEAPSLERASGGRGQPGRRTAGSVGNP